MTQTKQHNVSFDSALKKGKAGSKQKHSRTKAKKGKHGSTKRGSSPKVHNEQISRDAKPGSQKQSFLHNQKVADRNMLSVERSDKLANQSRYQILSGSTEQVDAILCQLNPHLLCAYLYGVVMAPLETSDDPTLIFTAINVWYTLCVQFSDIEDSLGNVALPRAIVRLRKALDARRVGKYSYAVDWGVYAQFVTTTLNVTNGLVAAFNNNQAVHNYLSVTGGIYGTFSSANTMVGGTNENEMSRYFGTFPAHFNPVSFADYVDDKNDASAFAFSQSPLVSNNWFNGTVGAFAGFAVGTEDQFITQSGSWGLETRSRRHDLASLRLCTPSYSGAVGSATANVLQNRKANYSGQSYGLPSVLGWSSRRDGIRGNVYLKPVPSTRFANAIIARIEALLKSVNAFTAFQAAFTQNQFKLLVYAWIKCAQAPYSGSHFNTAFLQSQYNGTNNQVMPAMPEEHANVFIAKACRLPEFVAKLIAAVGPSIGEQSALIPFFPSTDITTWTTSSGYATETITLTSGKTEAYNQYNAYGGIALLWKPFEKQLAQQENMVIFDGGIGKSYLSSTFLIMAGSYVGAIVSRSVLNGNAKYDHNIMCPAITYDVTENINLGFANYSASRAYCNKEYDTHCRNDLSGTEVLSTYDALFVAEGIVLNGFTNNMQGAMTSDTTFNGAGSGPAMSPLEASLPGNILTPAVPPGLGDVVHKWAARLIPRKGNYCGPGWTAGVETAVAEAKMVNGLYRVQPTDSEDAVCKEHDEAYARDDSLKGRAKADREMVAKLDNMARTKGLSLYMQAARIAIGVKAQLADGSASPMM